MTKQHKFFKGSVDEFKTWLQSLKKSAETKAEDQKKYNEISDSVVYISENFGKQPEEYFDDASFDGAIYAHGAVIQGGGSSFWTDDVDETI